MRLLVFAHRTGAAGLLRAGLGEPARGGGSATTPVSVMNRYTLTKKLGDGTYGSVLKAVNRQTGEEVAVKKMKKLFTRQVN